MTCIVGIEAEDGVYIGGDRAGSNYQSISSVGNSKVFSVNEGKMLIGYSGSFRFGQVLEHHLSLPYHFPEMDDYAYLVSQFVEQARYLAVETGSTRNEVGQDYNIGSALIAYNGHLWFLQEDFSVIRTEDGYAAAGSGYSYALGAMRGAYTMGVDVEPEKLVYMALDAAETHDPTVQGPYDVLHLPLPE